MSASHGVALLAVVAQLGCRDRPPPPVEPGVDGAITTASATPSYAAPPIARELPPLAGEWLVHLPLEGFGPAAVSVPLGAMTPRSVVVGVHGRNDRPEWACGEWRGVTDARPFVLCPHGVPADAPTGLGLAFAGSERTRREIDAGLAALKARFGAYVADGPMIYAGFSLGAILGVAIVADDPARFPIAVLGEGGQTEWTPARMDAFAKGGGRRVLFVCSTESCEVETARPLAALARAGVQVRLVSAGHIGHQVDDRVVATVRAAWPWVVGKAREPSPP
jgi:hypothetical protein